MSDIIDEMIATYAKYADAEKRDPEFWIACLKAGVGEVEESFKADDWKHMYAELADMVFIAVDALRKLGANPKRVLRQRLEENAMKDLSGRNLAYYREKIGLLRRGQKMHEC